MNITKEDILNQWSWLPYDKLMNYVDIVETDRVNNLDKYKAFNEFTPSELTIEQIKKFRTWLASTIISFNIAYDAPTSHMLNYYAGGMYDDVVSALTMFGTSISATSVLNTPTTSSCGCSNGVSVSLTNANICDSLEIYRRKIYEAMVKTFSVIDFWLDFDPEFLQMFKLYIDNIIKLNLPLTTSQYQTDFVDCTCQLKGNTEQEINIQRLTRLSKSLQYMIDGEIKGNRNYITTSLTDWATYLYERMEW